MRLTSIEYKQAVSKQAVKSAIRRKSMRCKTIPSHIVRASSSSPPSPFSRSIPASPPPDKASSVGGQSTLTLLAWASAGEGPLSTTIRRTDSDKGSHLFITA